MKILYKNNNWNIQNNYNIDKILYLLIDRPNRINSCNNFIWENKKSQYHRNYDLPAYIDKVWAAWYKNGHYIEK